MRAILLLLLCLALPVKAQEVTDQSRMVSKAVSTVERIKSDPNINQSMVNQLRRARAVLIVPDLVKGGFLIGAEYGTGVLLTRDANGTWSGPAFYSVASGSLGLQIGIQDSETVFVIMNDGALKAVMDNRFKAGAEAGVAIAHVGAGAQAATTTNAGADIYAYAKAVGMYGGASLAGSGILPRDSWNAAFYGGNPSPADILIARAVDSRHADRLRDVLGR